MTTGPAGPLKAKTPIPRSSTVEELISAKQAVPYEEVFKTRPKVRDDRLSVNSPIPSPQLVEGVVRTELVQDPYMQVTELAIPMKKPITIQLKPNGPTVVGRDSNQRNLEADLDTATAQESMKMMLKSTSEIFILPETEKKFLEQYRLDSTFVHKLQIRVDHLEHELNQVTEFIQQKAEEEELAITPIIIKLQAWYRGWRERKSLSARGISIQRHKKRYSLKTVSAVILIQARWFALVLY